MGSLLAERLWPYVASAIIAGAWFYFGYPVPGDANALFGAAVTVASVFAGFLIAAKAILLSLKDSAVFGALRQSGYLADFISYLREGINMSVLLVILTMCAFFIDFSILNARFQDGDKWFYTIWIFVSAATLFTYWRVSNCLFKLLRHA
jgi:hypothetical protein